MTVPVVISDTDAVYLYGLDINHLEMLREVSRKPLRFRTLAEFLAEYHPSE